MRKQNAEDWVASWRAIQFIFFSFMPITQKPVAQYCSIPVQQQVLGVSRVCLNKKCTTPKSHRLRKWMSILGLFDRSQPQAYCKASCRAHIRASPLALNLIPYSYFVLKGNLCSSPPRQCLTFPNSHEQSLVMIPL